MDIDDPEDLEEIFDLDDVDLPDHLDEDPNAGDLMRAKRIVIVVDWSAVDGYLMGLDLDE